MKTYEPIACGLYDHLEIFAMRKQEVQIVLHDGTSFTDTIQTLEARKGDGEYMVLISGREIRLDALQRVNDISFGANC